MTPFWTVALAHDGDHAVSLDGTGDREPDTHVAACQLHDGDGGTESAACLAVQNALQGGAVFDTSPGIEKFEFEEDASGQPGGESIEPNGGSVPNRSQHGMRSNEL